MSEPRRFGGAGIRRDLRGEDLISAAALTPLEFDPGLVRWFRGDLGKTIATGISVWTDQKEGVTVTQGVGADQPAEGSSIDGQATLEHSDNELLRGLGFASIAQQWFFYAVLEVTGAEVAQVPIDDGGGVGNSPTMQYTGGTWRVFAGSVLATGDVTKLGASAWLIDGNGASSRAFRDDFTTPLVTGDAGAANTDSLTVGATDAGAQPLTGAIAELILTTTDDRPTYRDYLNNRYPSLGIV